MQREDWPLPDRAFHLADAEKWHSIQRTGLHGAAAPIGQAEPRGAAALPFAGYRSLSMRLPSGVLMRDQRPMPPAAVARCLDAPAMRGAEPWTSRRRRRR